MSAVIGLVDPNAGGPGQVELPLVSDTLTAIGNQIGVTLPSLSLAADVGVARCCRRQLLRSKRTRRSSRRVR